eukprot:Gb_02305 [translate_table: standard]
MVSFCISWLIFGSTVSLQFARKHSGCQLWLLPIFCKHWFHFACKCFEEIFSLVLKNCFQYSHDKMAWPLDAFALFVHSLKLEPTCHLSNTVEHGALIQHTPVPL